MGSTILYLLVVAGVAAEYKCPIGPSVAVICDDYAVAAMIAGGTTSTTLGFPAIFFNRAIEDQPPVVFDNAADERCEYEQTELLEFPVNEDGTIFPKNNGGAGAAATRVVYLRDGKALCGVMTHLPPLGRPNTCMCERYRSCQYVAGRVR